MFFSTDRASQRARSVLKDLSPIFHGTDRTREVNKLFIIWLQYFSSSGGHFAFINNFDGFLVYYNKFNRQKFDISLYCPKFVKFLSCELIFCYVGCENSKYTCMMHV